MGIFFAILSPAIGGVNNYIDKYFLEKYEIDPIVISIISGIFAFFTGLIILAFTGVYYANLKSILIIVVSGFLTGIYILPYYKALNQDETSRIVPLFEFIPVFVLILSFLFLGEKLYIKQYIGATAIIIGAVLLSMKKLDHRIFKLRPAFWQMAVSSLLFAISIVLYKFGVEQISFWHTLPYEGFGIALGALSIYLYKYNKMIFWKETRKFSKKVFILMYINEGIYIAFRYMTYFALSLLPASIVNVLSGFSPLFVLLYGLILSLWFPDILKEIISKKVLFQKIISIFFMFMGLYFIFF